MSRVMERKGHIRRHSPDQLDSSAMDRRSAHRSSLRRERSPAHPRTSPSMRSPRRTISSHRVRSPMKERLRDRSRSPKQVRGRSPPRTSLSRSPSPRTKRLMRAQYEKETDRLPEKGHERHTSREERDEGRRRAQYEKVADRLPEKGHERNASREEHDEGRHKNHGEGRDARNERRSAREVNDGGPSRSSRHARSSSREERGHRSRYNSGSPPIASNAGGREEATKSKQTEESWDGDRDSVAKMKAAEEALENKEKQQKPSFELSGKLAEETNRVRGVTLLFNEPPDARKPDTRWRLYVFKAGEVLNEPLYVHRQTCYLFGRERRVADIPTDHPSCSKQHAVLQFRFIEKEQADGLLSKQVRPYLMDLGSTNGSFVNDNRIEPQRYYELFEKDTIRFGNSSREYVLLHEHSAG